MRRSAISFGLRLGNSSRCLSGGISRSSTSSDANVTMTVIYANTDSALYKLDPGSMAVTLIGSFSLDDTMFFVSTTGDDLVHFINLLDKSDRLLIIESLNATPQQTGGRLNVMLKLDTFVQEDGSAP